MNGFNQEYAPMSIDISALNILDYSIIIILAVSAILSTLRGMTREALGLVGWPIAIFAAIYSAPVIELLIFSLINLGGIGKALSWALPFAVVVVLWFVLASILAPGLKRAGLGALDRWLGVIFGLVRGYVIAVLTYAVPGLWKAKPTSQNRLVRRRSIHMSGPV